MNMKPHLVNWAAVIAVFAFAVDSVKAQAAEQCVRVDTDSTFGFLIGSWEGQERLPNDTTTLAWAQVQARPIASSCILEEQWSVRDKNGPLFEAHLLRAYDAASGRWGLSYADDHSNAQWYTGARAGDAWAFQRERIVDGTPALARVSWMRTSTGYRQTVERSLDGGATWVLRSISTFTPSR